MLSEDVEDCRRERSELSFESRRLFSKRGLKLTFGVAVGMIFLVGVVYETSDVSLAERIDREGAVEVEEVVSLDLLVDHSVEKGLRRKSLARSVGDYTSTERKQTP